MSGNREPIQARNWYCYKDDHVHSFRVALWLYEEMYDFCTTQIGDGKHFGYSNIESYIRNLIIEDALRKGIPIRPRKED